MLNPANASKQMLSKARDEIEEQGLGERGSYLDYDNQKDLRYVTALWQETTRIHPASARGVTLCYEDDVLPAIPEINQPAVQVKKGDLVHWQDWVMNRCVTFSAGCFSNFLLDEN